MRIRIPAIAMGVALLLTSCSPAPDGTDRSEDSDRPAYSAPRPEATTSSPPEATIAQSLSNQCVPESYGAQNEFLSATLSADEASFTVDYEFERPFVLDGAAPNSVSVDRPERLIAHVGPVTAVAFISVDYEADAMQYVIRDDVVSGNVLHGASLVKQGKHLQLTAPLPADLDTAASPTQWRVEAQGVECPTADDYDEGWLLTDLVQGE